MLTDLEHMHEIKEQNKKARAVTINAYDAASLYPSAGSSTSATFAVASTSGLANNNKRKKPAPPAPGPVQPSPSTAAAAARKKGGAKEPKGAKKQKKNDPLTQESQFPLGVEGEITISEDDTSDE